MASETKYGSRQAGAEDGDAIEAGIAAATVGSLILIDVPDPRLRLPLGLVLSVVVPFGLILMHDASSHLKIVREAALKLEQDDLISTVLLPTPRGLVLAQKKEGRK